MKLHRKVGAVLLVVTFASWLSARGPAALEEKRLADQCNATHGFSTPEARTCMEFGADRLAMRSY